MALTLGLLTVTGCIVPQDDHVLDPLTPVLNRPPRIIPEQTQPTGTPVVLGNGTNCSKLFSVNVEDPDVSDSIFYAFYIDYKPSNATNPVYSPGVLAASGRAQRSSAAQVTFNSDSVVNLFTVGTHFVDVVIADSPITSDRTARKFNPGPVLVDGGEGEGTPYIPLADGGASIRYSDSYTWSIDTRATGDCQ